MTECAVPAVVLRRRPYGDADLILTVLTADRGKRTLLARSARRSVRRFAGCLDPFSLVRIVAGRARGGLDDLREAVLDQAFPHLRTDPLRVALASLWAEGVDRWLELEAPQPALFELVRTALTTLDAGDIPAERVHLIFQLRFLALAGLSPDLAHCRGCGRPLDGEPVFADLPAGGFRCPACLLDRRGERPLPLGVLPRLRRIARPDAPHGPTDPTADGPAAELLERFLSHHLGRTPRSLTFLRDLRNAGTASVSSTERGDSHAGPSA